MTATAIRDGCGIPDRTVFCMANLNDIRPGAWARWLLLGVVAVHLAIVWWNRDPAMINADTAQLVTATQNLLDGRGYSTSALYYEEQHALGNPPVPLTLWPPGFTGVMVPFVAIGMSGLDAAFVVAAFGFILTVLFTYKVAITVGLGTLPALFASCGLALLAQFGILVVNAVSEPLYIAATVASAFFLVGAGASTQTLKQFWLAGAFAGLAMLFRYAGVAWIAAALMSILLLHWRDGLKPLVGRLYAFGALPCAVVVGLFARNLLLVGSVTGGPTVGGDVGVREAVQGIYWTMLRLFGAFDNAGEPIAAVALGLLTVYAALRAMVIASGRPDRLGQDVSARAADGFVVLSVAYGAMTVLMLGYLSFKMYAGLAQERYLVPLAPFGWILGALLIQRSGRLAVHSGAPLRRVWALVPWVIALGYGVGQLQVAANEWAVRKGHPQVFEARDVWGEFIDGEPVARYLKRRVTFQEPLLTADGQMLAAFLEIPVIGMPERRYSRKNWNEQEVRDLMRGMGACLLMVYPAWHRLKRDDSFFLVELSKGTRPDWLLFVHGSPRMQIYRGSWCND
jgi:hypothetical protein